jgi:hypothetical protein
MQTLAGQGTGGVTEGAQEVTEGGRCHEGVSLWPEIAAPPR